MITIYSRKDLKRDAKNKKITEVQYSDFQYNTKPFIKADLVLFVDEDSQCKILKSRYKLNVDDLLVSFLPFVPKMITDFTSQDGCNHLHLFSYNKI